MNHFWLKIYEGPREIDNSNSSVVKYNHEDMKIFWKRVNITIRLTRLIQNSVIIIFICLATYFIYKSSLKKYYLTFAFVNSLHIASVLSTSIPIFLISMCGFHHICYYFTIRFKHINHKLSKFLQVLDKSDKMKQHNLTLIRLLREHNRICIDLSQFNHFWNVCLAIKYLLFPLGI